MSILPARRTGNTHKQIWKAIPVNIGKCCTGGPKAITSDARLFRYIFKMEVTFIQIQPISHSITSEIDVKQTIVIDIG